ncbi:MAG: DUF3473 domain-containing protein [Saprospiraceae bacterium]|nr:DUF3473 domain-containing protein [Saprospiraceae bacterium]
MKLFPTFLYNYLCKNILKKHDYVLIYVHPWEFADLSNYKLPNYIKKYFRVKANAWRNKFEKDFVLFGYLGSFSTIRGLFKDSVGYGKVYLNK